MYGITLSLICYIYKRYGIEASRGMAYGTALVLIVIVLLVNLLANALRSYFAKKVKMN